MKTHVIDGVTYVEVDRQAEVGDMVLIVNAGATNGMYDNGDIIFAERTNGDGIFNNKVRSSTTRCHNPNGYIDDSEYRVLELAQDEATVDESQASPQVIEMLTALSRKIVSLESQLRDTQRNVETWAELTESNTHDIVLLDERTQVLNAVSKFYEGDADETND